MAACSRCIFIFIACLAAYYYCLLAVYKISAQWCILVCVLVHMVYFAGLIILLSCALNLWLLHWFFVAANSRVGRDNEENTHPRFN